MYPSHGGAAIINGLVTWPVPVDNCTMASFVNVLPVMELVIKEAWLRFAQCCLLDEIHLESLTECDH